MWPWLAGVAAVVALVVIVCCTLGTVGALQRLASIPPVALSTVMPTPVATDGATPTLVPTPASVVLYQNTFTSDAIGWPNDSKCHLGADGYHVTSWGCTAPVGITSNVDIKAQVKQLSGPPTDLFGFMLRIGTDGGKRYDVDIDSTGEWMAFRCIGKSSDGKTANCKTIAGPKSNSAIHRGLGVNNTLEVHAKGTNFQVYVNGTHVGTFTDSTYSSGYLGLETSLDAGAVFSNFSVSLLN